MEKQIIIIIILILSIVGCEKSDSGFTDAGEPVSVYLVGKWELKKIENTKTSKIMTQLAYMEILENGNENGEDFNKVYKNGVLIDTYIRARSRGTEESVKNMTVLDRFRNDKVRFYRIVNANTGNISIEASAYLQEVGIAADTLKYYYVPAK
jgi:hypothetical protein